jgi:hypothetical protein
MDYQEFMKVLLGIFHQTGFLGLTWGHVVMWLVGLFFSI